MFVINNNGADEAVFAFRVTLLALEQEGLEPVMNATAPEPVRNEEFTRTLAKVLRRPAIFPVPV